MTPMTADEIAVIVGDDRRRRCGFARGNTRLPTTRALPAYARRIRQIRAKLGLSQRDTALSVGISQASYNAYERGTARPGVGHILALRRLGGLSDRMLLRFLEEIELASAETT